MTTTKKKNLKKKSKLPTINKPKSIAVFPPSLPPISPETLIYFDCCLCGRDHIGCVYVEYDDSGKIKSMETDRNNWWGDNNCAYLRSGNDHNIIVKAICRKCCQAIAQCALDDH